MTKETSCELCERSPPDADGWHPSPYTAHGWYRCKNSSIGGNATTVSSAVSASGHGKATASDGVPTSPETGARTSKTVCSDCPPAGYPTDKTRCYGCPLANTYRDATGELVLPAATPSSKQQVDAACEYFGALSARVDRGDRNVDLSALIEHAAALVTEIGRLERRPDEASPALLEIARDISTMDCFYSGSTCAPDCKCIVARAEKAIGSSVEPTCTCGSKDGLHEFTCQFRRDGDDGKGAVKASVERCPWTGEGGSPCIYVRGHTAPHCSESRAAWAKAQCSENGSRDV